jgi:hypothetical protein
MTALRKGIFCALSVFTLAVGFAAAAAAAPFVLQISIGIRETGTAAAIGGDGGSTGGIEWVDLDGQLFSANGTWQQFVFTPTVDTLTAFAGATANGVLDTATGVFEHIRLRSTGDLGPWSIFIDDVANGGTAITGFESFPTAAEEMFQEPLFSGSTNGNLELFPHGSGVSDLAAHTGLQSFQIRFQFIDNDPTRWVRLTTFNTPNRPNPAVDFTQPISFWLMSPGNGPDLTPVPEPATTALVMIGLAGLGVVRRRRRG